MTNRLFSSSFSSQQALCFQPIIIRLCRVLDSSDLRMFLVFLVLSVSPASGAVENIERMFLSMLGPDSSPPTEREFHSNVDGDIDGLSQPEIQKLLPFAQSAIRSSQPKIREYGLQFLLAVSLRQAYDSAVLLKPCIPDLKKIAGAKNDPLKQLALTVIVYFRPSVPKELLEFLAFRLEKSEDTDEEAGIEAVALIDSKDPAFIQRAVRFARSGKRTFVAGKVIQTLGLIQTDDVEALSFIESSLRSPDHYVRWWAVEAASHFPSVRRVRFLQDLNRMAADPNETNDLKRKIADVLKN